MPRVVFFQHGGDGAFELADRALDGLVGIGRTILDNHGLPPRQPGLQGALNLVRIGLGVAVFVGDMGFHARHVLAKTGKRIFHHAAQMVGHFMAAVCVGVGIQENLHKASPCEGKGGWRYAWAKVSPSCARNQSITTGMDGQHLSAETYRHKCS